MKDKKCEYFTCGRSGKCPYNAENYDECIEKYLCCYYGNCEVCIYSDECNKTNN